VRGVALDLACVVGDVVHVQQVAGRVDLVGPVPVLRSRGDELAVLVDAVVGEAAVHQLGVVTIVAAGVPHDHVEDRLAVLQVLHVFE
jgi:hypothetical protein